MMAMGSRPHIVRSNTELVTLPRYLVVEAAMDATTLTDDLARALHAIEQRVWGNNRAAAITEITRALARLEQARPYFLDLAGIADTTPTDPDATAVAAAA